MQPTFWDSDSFNFKYQKIMVAIWLPLNHRRNLGGGSVWDVVVQPGPALGYQRLPAPSKPEVGQTMLCMLRLLTGLIITYLVSALPIHLFCLSVCVPVCLSTCLSVCLCACVPVSLPACLPTVLPTCQFVYLCLSICLSICLSACLPVYLSI